MLANARLSLCHGPTKTGAPGRDARRRIAGRLVAVQKPQTSPLILLSNERTWQGCTALRGGS